MLRLRETGRLRILDFDIETRKVGFFQAGKFSPDGCEPTAIAAMKVGIPPGLVSSTEELATTCETVGTPEKVVAALIVVAELKFSQLTGGQ